MPQVTAIDKHLDEHETVYGSEMGQDICIVYKKVKPILEFSVFCLFWKPRWQAVIKGFMAVMDKGCEDGNLLK